MRGARRKGGGERGEKMGLFIAFFFSGRCATILQNKISMAWFRVP